MPHHPAHLAPAPATDRRTCNEVESAGEAENAGGAEAVAVVPASDRRHNLVLAHQPLVGHIVRDVLTRLPTHVDRSDLVSAGLVALTVAARAWEPQRGVPFARYAAIRIRGAITDELRSLDWASRGVRSRARTIADTRTALQSTLGRTPTDAEVQTATGYTAAELTASAADTARACMLSLDTPTGEAGAGTLAATAPDPAGLLIEREALGYLTDAIAELPERLRFVVHGYFFDQRPMAELAAALGVTDSRISQLRSEAVRLLRAGLHQPLLGTPDPSTHTVGPRAAAARHAYTASVAARSTATARLRHTTTLADTITPPSGPPAPTSTPAAAPAAATRSPASKTPPDPPGSTRRHPATRMSTARLPPRSRFRLGRR